AEYIAHIVFKSKRESLSRDIWKTVVVIIILASLTLPFIYIYNDPNLGPSVLSANMFLYYLPIAFVGFLYKTYGKYFEVLKRIHLVRWITASIALVIYIITLIKFPNWLGGLNGSFLDIAYHMIGSLSGVIFYYYLALAIQNLKVVRRMSSFAKYSGPFYLVHVFLIRLLASYLPRPEVFDSSAILFIVFLTIGFYFGTMVITIILVKCPVSDIILFGDVKMIMSVNSLISPKHAE
ncbi:MAG: hypothetical protein EOM76_07715, partial [Sphingobacteriia bacterium]|nr:hypothetical protein [Sphingobacteriia bacterium]